MGKLWFIAALMAVLCVSGCSAESSVAGQKNASAVTAKSLEPAEAKGVVTLANQIKLNISQQEYTAVLEKS